MNSLIAQRLLGVVVKYGIFALGNLLVAHSALTEDQAHRMMSNETVETVVGVVLTMAPVLWSMRGNVTHLRELVAALHLAPGSTLEDVKVRALRPDIKASGIEKV